jgi:hypothetical protein
VLVIRKRKVKEQREENKELYQRSRSRKIRQTIIEEIKEKTKEIEIISEKKRSN